MNTVGVETFVNCLGSLQESRHRRIRHDDVDGCEGFALVEAPDV